MLLNPALVSVFLYVLALLLLIAIFCLGVAADHRRAQPRRRTALAHRGGAQVRS